MTSSYPLYRLKAISQALFIKITRKRCAGYSAIRSRLAGKLGLEFGGPSPIFSENNLIPIYGVAGAVDNCNFAKQTLWSTKNRSLRARPRAGRQFIVDACDASEFSDESYDFVVASHVLEHLANPLRALNHWKRILRPSGVIIVVVPHKSGMFDHRRPFTTFDHIKADFEANVAESDLTHLEEILTLHDLTLDRQAGSFDEFRRRCLQNAEHRAMHHHVFSPELLVEMFSLLQMRIASLAVERPFHIIVQAVKADPNESRDAVEANSTFLGTDATWQGRDPFVKLKHA
jgi:SAM-dependent methyltransferase